MTVQVRFRFATLPDELRQVHALNHRTFVDEIPQHAPVRGGMLIDRFDDENTYIIAVQGSRVLGMVSVRDRRPWSLDAKVADLDSLLPPNHRYCEVRLLAVEPECRGTTVLAGLLHHVAHFCTAIGFDAAVISGAERQLQLYAHLGFLPIGPRVGTDEAPYQPMYVILDRFRDATARLLGRTLPAFEPASFLPGPVDLSSEVQAALSQMPHSHRDADFQRQLGTVRATLQGMTGSEAVAILAGSGTLANDVVAIQLATLRGRGVVLSNGEFGERLVDHAVRAGLHFDVERSEWGSAFDADAIGEIAGRHPEAAWLWMVHHETSTGVLNDVRAAAGIVHRHGKALCADCVSSLGLVPLDLRGVWLATGVSGKALGGPAGLAMVFSTRPPAPTPEAPRYLDLERYIGNDGVPFTMSSALLAGLAAALPAAIDRLRNQDAQRWTIALRRALRVAGLRPLREGPDAAPGIVTAMLNGEGAARELGDALAHAGLAASYRSDYLLERNCIQFAAMGPCTPHKVALLERVLATMMKNDRLPTPRAGSRSSTVKLGLSTRRDG